MNADMFSEILELFLSLKEHRSLYCLMFELKESFEECSMTCWIWWLFQKNFSKIPVLQEAIQRQRIP